LQCAYNHSYAAAKPRGRTAAFRLTNADLRGSLRAFYPNQDKARGMLPRALLSLVR
jgi:hypothetical protein